MERNNMDKLKQIELDILKSFIEVCNKLNLTYYVVGGTLLGTIRHGGFIPWDDDIDVAMPRKDYEIFLEQGQQLLPDYYFIQTRKTDVNYPLFFAKIRDSRTTFIENDVRKIFMNHGIYLDIFPIDNYPKSKVKAKMIAFKRKILLLRVRTIYLLDDKNKKNFILEFLFKIFSFFIKIIYPTLNHAMKSWDKMCKKTKKSEMAAVYSSPGKSVVFPFKWLGQGVKMTFEDSEVNCPAEYSKWLENLYGDYMQLPPIEKRVAQHNTSIIDVERPFTDYIVKQNNKKEKGT